MSGYSEQGAYAAPQETRGSAAHIRSTGSCQREASMVAERGRQRHTQA